ncbi:MAG TPA: HAD family hydrolase [Trebonia sp.]|nr:HAD family hydrolase [Trebonia sp.]
MSASGRSGWLVLDVDDTLVDTRRTGLAKVRRVAADLGLPHLPAADFDAAYGTRSFPACVATWFPETDVEAFCAGYDRSAAAIPPVPLCDGGRIVTAARAAGMGVGVLTNGPGGKTEVKLAAVGLTASALDFVCHADNWPVAKPHPNAFAGLTAFGLQPDRTWYVSDAAADCRGSQAAGLRTVGVAAAGAAGRSAGPDLVLSRTALLESVIPALPDLPPRTFAGPPRAVGFDAGFTLVQDRADAADLVAARLRAAGKPVLEATVRAALGDHRHLLADRTAWSSDASIARLLDTFYRAVLRALGDAEPDHSAAAVIARYTSAENWRALPGAQAALGLARARGLSTGVLSNWQSSLDQVLSATGLRDLLDAVVASADVGAAKPAPAAFAALADALGIRVGALVYVGDDAAGDAAGVLGVGGRAVLIHPAAGREERIAAVAMALPGRPVDDIDGAQGS